jgi:hypothetical protein
MWYVIPYILSVIYIHFCWNKNVDNRFWRITVLLWISVYSWCRNRKIGYPWRVLNEVATCSHLDHNACEAQRRWNHVFSPGVLYNKEDVFFNVMCARQYNMYLLSRQPFDIPRWSNECDKRVGWTEKMFSFVSCQSLIWNVLCDIVPISQRSSDLVSQLGFR